MDGSINQGCLIIRLTVKYFEERLGFFVEAVNDVFGNYMPGTNSVGSSWMETSSRLKSVDWSLDFSHLCPNISRFLSPQVLGVVQPRQPPRLLRQRLQWRVQSLGRGTHLVGDSGRGLEPYPCRYEGSCIFESHFWCTTACLGCFGFWAWLVSRVAALKWCRVS